MPGYPGIPGGRNRGRDEPKTGRARVAWIVAYVVLGAGCLALVVVAFLSAD